MQVLHVCISKIPVKLFYIKKKKFLGVILLNQGKAGLLAFTAWSTRLKHLTKHLSAVLYDC